MNKAIKIIIVFILAGAALIYAIGCGKVPNNSGLKTVTGTVYTFDEDRVLIPSASAVVWINGVSAETNAQGRYSVPNVSGETIGITFYGIGEQQTYMCYQTSGSTINFYPDIDWISYDCQKYDLLGDVAGTATISGDTAYQAEEIHAMSTAKNAWGTPAETSYSISAAPDDGDVYVFASFTSLEGEVEHTVSDYGVLQDVQPGQSRTLDFNFDSFIAISGEISGALSEDPGYSWAEIFLCQEDKAYFRLIPNVFLSESFGYLEKYLPQIVATGDSFSVIGWSMNTDETLFKMAKHEGVTRETTVDFDFATIPTFAGVTYDAVSHVLSWEAYPASNVVYFIEVNGGEAYLDAFTKGTSVEVPKALLDVSPNLYCEIYAVKMKAGETVNLGNFKSWEHAGEYASGISFDFASLQAGALRSPALKPALRKNSLFNRLRRK